MSNGAWENLKMIEKNFPWSELKDDSYVLVVLCWLIPAEELTQDMFKLPPLLHLIAVCI